MSSQFRIRVYYRISGTDTLGVETDFITYVYSEATEIPNNLSEKTIKALLIKEGISRSDITIDTFEYREG